MADNHLLSHPIEGIINQLDTGECNSVEQLRECVSNLAKHVLNLEHTLRGVLQAWELLKQLNKEKGLENHA